MSSIRELTSLPTGYRLGILALAVTLLQSNGPAQDTPAPQPTPLPGLIYDQPFFPNAKYDTNVPKVESVLGFLVGSKPATYGQIEAAIKALSGKSPRCKLVEYGRTHEGRALY